MQTKTAMESPVIILDSLDFAWYAGEIEKALWMWNNGRPFEEMVDTFRPKNNAMGRTRSEGEVEVFMLLMHLGLKGKLKERPGKIWGTLEVGKNE